MEALLKHLNKLSFFYPSFLVGRVPVDKFLHFITGACGAVVISFFIGYWAILVISLLAGIKEWYDYKHPLIHTCDVWDWVATSSGGIVGVMTTFGWFFNI